MLLLGGKSLRESREGPEVQIIMPPMCCADDLVGYYAAELKSLSRELASRVLCDGGCLLLGREFSRSVPGSQASRGKGSLVLVLFREAYTRNQAHSHRSVYIVFYAIKGEFVDTTVRMRKDRSTSESHRQVCSWLLPAGIQVLSGFL